VWAGWCDAALANSTLKAAHRQIKSSILACASGGKPCPPAARLEITTTAVFKLTLSWLEINK